MNKKLIVVLCVILFVICVDISVKNIMTENTHFKRIQRFSDDYHRKDKNAESIRYADEDIKTTKNLPENESIFSKYKTLFKENIDSLKKELNKPKNEYEPEKQAPQETNDIAKDNTQDEKVDFSSYMSKLQKDIKVNWNPPKCDESVSVVAFFSVYKDGHLGKDIKILKSSGHKSIDDAAIEAIKKTSPFDPLPQKFTGEKVDIQFTFDYNAGFFNNKH